MHVITLSAIRCKDPICVNNYTLTILMDDNLIGDSGRYLCDPGYAFPGDIMLKNFTCEKKFDPDQRIEYGEWNWNETEEGECESKLRIEQLESMIDSKIRIVGKVNGS